MEDNKYRAPALEKGLDILELLAANQSPMTVSQISNSLNRSVSELFRMIQVLEGRGYLSQSIKGDGLELTNKLFGLGMSRGPSQNLLGSALPIMQRLSDETRQSVHLTIASRDKIVVIARIEAPGELGFSVRPGHQRPLIDSTSGLVLYGFMSEHDKSAWEEKYISNMKTDAWKKFKAESDLSVEQGYGMRKSDYVIGVTDFSCPIKNEVTVIGALTIPHIHSPDSFPIEHTIEQLKIAANNISSDIGG